MAHLLPYSGALNHISSFTFYDSSEVILLIVPGFKIMSYLAFRAAQYGKKQTKHNAIILTDIMTEI